MSYGSRRKCCGSTAEHEAAAALCLKLGMRSCKELRKTTHIYSVATEVSQRPSWGRWGRWFRGCQCSVSRQSFESAAIFDGVQRLAEGLQRGWARTRCRQ